MANFCTWFEGWNRKAIQILIVFVLLLAIVIETLEQIHKHEDTKLTTASVRLELIERITSESGMSTEWKKLMITSWTAYSLLSFYRKFHKNVINIIMIRTSLQDLLTIKKIFLC